MTQTILHFVFTPSGGGCLVQALRKAGRDDPVIASSDDLSFGPINPVDPRTRSKWAEKELGRTDWISIPTKSERVWDESRFPDNRKIAWLTRRSAMEYAGFLEWLSRLGDTPCDIVDLTEIEVSYRPEHGPPEPPQLAMSLGYLHHDKIYSDRLWDLARPLQQDARDRYRNLWQRLRSEDAPLRVINGGDLVSAPISFFDSMVMACVTNDWQKVSRVLGDALVAKWDDCTIQTGDTFLTGRINALVDSGRLEMQGKSALEIFDSWVRLPQTQ
jgi:hypothetical protein